MPIASAFLQPAQDLRIGGRGGGALYQYTIQSDNIDDLAHWGPILYQNMQKLPDLQDVNTDQQNGGLQEMLNYDRVTAARLGQTPQSLDSALCSAFCQSEVSVIYTQLNQYYVVHGSCAAVLAGSVGAEQHLFHLQPVVAQPALNVDTRRLFTVMKPSTNTTPLQVGHTGLFPSVTVSFNLATASSLSDATREVTQMEQRLGMPATVRGFFAGTAAGLPAVVLDANRSWSLTALACGLYRPRHSL